MKIRVNLLRIIFISIWILLAFSFVANAQSTPTTLPTSSDWNGSLQSAIDQFFNSLTAIDMLMFVAILVLLFKKLEPKWF